MTSQLKPEHRHSKTEQMPTDKPAAPSAMCATRITTLRIDLGIELVRALGHCPHCHTVSQRMNL